MELSDIRKDIDEIDNQLIELFVKRMKCAEQVATIKAKTKAPVFNQQREEEILAEVEKKGGEYGSSAKIVFSTLMEVSRNRQYEILGRETALKTLIEDAHTDYDLNSSCFVACQGVKGAYSQEAAVKFFPNSKQVFYNHFSDVFDAVENNWVDFGVVPVENSTAGSVAEVYDLLLKYRHYIVGAAEIKVNHCLAAKTEDITKLKKVYSHPQGLNQCTKFIEQYKLEASSYSNTAAAAKLVAESKDESLCAICSKQAAQIRGLKIVRESIQNTNHNSTRFVVISKKPLITKNADKISLCFALKHSVGSLHAVLSRIAGRGLNLTKIESRPIADKPFEYNFYLDFIGSSYDDKTADLLSSLSEELPEFGFLGNYKEISF